ncbi:MAG: phytanoyl-CoA dioxygenase family protein [Bdellovibrionota bacterium]|nr:phytanoyl-CoA dioxygenase family protein [Bdellovibrionota bacterium]
MEHGFKIIKNFLSSNTLKELEEILLRHHKSWCEENLDFYRKKAVNSAYLTKKESCPDEDRDFLFKLISSDKIYKELDSIFSNKDPCFLNTQLFFDPFNIDQKNYWHRDIQYTGLPLEEQKKSVEEDANNVVHFRFAIRDENGIELIPNTNKRWDSSLEYDTRLGLNGRTPSDDLPDGESITLNKGDLLIFSANMIHRGLYGKDRLAFDVLFCKPDPEILCYADISCYPEKEKLKKLDNKIIFKKLYEIKSSDLI